MFPSDFDDFVQGSIGDKHHSNSFKDVQTKKINEFP